MSPESRWRECIAPYGAPESAIADTWRGLEASYCEAIRHYHDLAHVGALLALSSTHARHLRDRPAVDLAIFYHDVVYDPARGDNEARSADRARVELAELGLPSPLVERVCALIDLTRHGAVEPETADSDAHHFLDFDLSVLAAETSVYDAYAAAIRREYAHVPEAAYKAGRAKVLAGFLAMPSIYHVEAFRRAWETRARDNLSRELAQLQPAA